MLDPIDRDAGRLSLVAIDDICDAFEERWRGGTEPRIEDFLSDYAEPARGQLFCELMKVELEYRNKRQAEDYNQRFPEFVGAWDALGIKAPAAEQVSASNLTTPFQASGKDPELALPAIPGYKILSRVGEGGMGVVYKAQQLKAKRIVALKMMRAGQFATVEERQRFRFEAEASAALDHPNIVPVYDIGEVNGDAFLCLKYLESGSLEARMKERTYSPTEAATLLADVALAVQHAHDRGVLHRDLKPGNILLDAEEKPHVSDFGLARWIAAEHSLTPTGAIVGTPNYMAPEQARGSREVTVKADVFALGAVLYELLVGVPPVKGATLQETLALLLQEEPVARPRDRNPRVPRALEAVCLKCLEKDPANRYASAAALADDLRRFLNDEPVSAQPPSVWDWLVQAMRTRPAASPEHTWQAPVCIGLLLFIQNAAIYILVRTAQPSWLLWEITLGGSFGMFLVLWFLNLPRFRIVPVTERHSIMLALGHLIAHVVLFLAVMPWSMGASCRPVLALYPALTVVTGLCLFVLGSTNWGRLLPIGAATMCLALIVAAYPEKGPLIYAATAGCAVSGWGLAMWWYFVRSR